MVYSDFTPVGCYWCFISSSAPPPHRSTPVTLGACSAGSPVPLGEPACADSPGKPPPPGPVPPQLSGSCSGAPHKHELMQAARRVRLEEQREA